MYFRVFTVERYLKQSLGARLRGFTKSEQVTFWKERARLERATIGLALAPHLIDQSGDAELVDGSSRPESRGLRRDVLRSFLLRRMSPQQCPIHHALEHRD